VLTPGQFARVQVEGSGKFAALLIDGKAVMTDQDRKFVWVVGADNTAQRRDLVLGAEIDGLYVVKSGLKPGERVVVEGVQKVFFPGMPVKASNVAMDRDVAPAAKAAAEAIAAAASADAALAKAN
jgi:multidrug efflux system membrane fusion protein